MRTDRLLRAAGIALALAFASAAPARADKTFSFRIAGDPHTLDWNLAGTTIDGFIITNLMEGLVFLDSALKPSAALAQSWVISPDGLTYTFKLRPGVKWSDGVPLKAQDFVYSWKRLLDSKTGSQYAYVLFDIEGAQEFHEGKVTDFAQVGIKAPDEATFEIKLKHPVSYWLSVPAFWVTFPLRQDVVEKAEGPWDKPGRMATVGPFTLTARDLGSKVVLSANPNYYGEHGNVEQAVGVVVHDNPAAVALYQSGKLDLVTGLNAETSKLYAGKPDLHTFTQFRTMYLGFNVSKSPVNSVAVRKAIAMSIRKDKLAPLRSGWVPASTFVPEGMHLGYSPKAGLPFDPAKAKATLKAAGFDPGKKIVTELLTRDDPQYVLAATYIVNELKQNLGMEVAIRPYDYKSFFTELYGRTYPLILSGWTADYPDPDNMLSVFLAGGGHNPTKWGSSKYDAAIIRARGLKDPMDRDEIYFQTQRLLLEEDAVVVPLCYDNTPALVSPKVKGLELNPLNVLILRKVQLD